MDRPAGREKTGMEVSFCFVVFRLFGIGLSAMILYNIKRNHSNKRKARKYVKVLASCLFLLVADFVMTMVLYLSDKTDTMLDLVFDGIFLGLIIISAVHLAIYAYFFLDIEIRHRNRMLKKVIEDAICIIPSIVLTVVAFIDKSQDLTIALLLLYLMALYIDNQNELISLDPLTRLNNRNELTGYLWYKLSTPMRGRICLLMMDMNRFKSINDTYGHVEGDQALIAVASCLKKACGGIPGRPFIARYGGDEFIVVMETESDLDVDHLCDYIHMTLAVENHRLKKPYNLSISIGWVRNEQNNRSIKKLLRRADIELYEKKRQFKERERTA